MSSDNKRFGAAGPDPNSRISQKLRELYRSVEQEPVPERFLDLLEQLDQAEESNAAKTDKNSR
ncbi:NepR family anti-sigma factor [Roseibium salinum]|uniref:NepR family anti-sigma factor n=1 Tax=Roseibium salinum TaxID=1604349 RepID=A0ABT3R439_9HYPH|nr:NepR family anti-sigma factor [Roseibium sp. DSM 29163]MCX2723960.1 NepR family anti-sigma factor [Roseibium sp. DSM 29163]